VKFEIWGFKFSHFLQFQYPFSLPASKLLPLIYRKRLKMAEQTKHETKQEAKKKMGKKTTGFRALFARRD